jgi:hypothetical protein
LFGLFFDPEDEGDRFLRNVGWLSPDYKALFPRRYRQLFITTAIRTSNPTTTNGGSGIDSTTCILNRQAATNLPTKPRLWWSTCRKNWHRPEGSRGHMMRSFRVWTHLLLKPVIGNLNPSKNWADRKKSDITSLSFQRNITLSFRR